MSNAPAPTSLLVPIHIDGLAVGRSLPPPRMFQWTNPAPDFSKLRREYLFGSELDGNNGNPFAQAEGLEVGVHLHFRLPRALTHGHKEGPGDVSFPPIPNRWLVQRFGGTVGVGGKLDYKAWLIESDVETRDDSRGLTWPTFDEHEPVRLKTVGTRTELTGPLPEQGEARGMRMTAVGPGNPAFSAFYPAARDVLGFYDPMADAPAGARLSYLVTGWYSDPQDDPLAAFFADFRSRHSITAADLTQAQQEQQFAELQAWAAERDWLGVGSKTDDAPPRLRLPSRILCHGLLRGIVWRGPDFNYMQSTRGSALSQPSVFPANADEHATAYKLAVGDTVAEAVSALLAAGEVDQDLLTALQGDILSQPVAAADLQAELHERRFGAVPGGTVFLIRQEPEQLGADKAARQPKPSRAERIPAGCLAMLRDLNEKQRRCDRLARRVEDCRWQVFALWFLLTSELKNGVTDETRPRAERLEKQLDVVKAALASERALWASACADRDASAARMDGELAKYQKTLPDGTPGFDKGGKVELKYRLAPSAAPTFQRPNDPGIAVQGPAMTRLNTRQPNGKLSCRMSGREVTGVRLQIPADAPLTITAEQLMAALFAPNKLPDGGGIHRALFGESLLLDEQYAVDIAALTSQRDTAELVKTVKSLQDPTSTEAQARPPQLPNALVGTLPDRTAAFNWKANPWVPLFLVWEVSWRSDYRPPVAGSNGGRSLPEDLLAGRWGLDKNAYGAYGGDLVRRGGGAGPELEEEPAEGDGMYRGYSILTPSVANNLADRLEKLNASHPLVNVLKNQRVLAQVLDGFNDALTLQQPGMQLPPLDFNAWWNSRGAAHKIDAVHDAVNEGFEERRDTFRTAPRADGPFLPIRAGRMEITRLSVVDAFGQTLILPVEQINSSARNVWPERMLRLARSCSHASAVAAPRARAFAELRPRFAQPTRLRFEWAKASAADGDGPVCGWVLPNHLEKSITLYSASGKPLGALQRKLGLQPGGSAPAFYWVDVPGGPEVSFENSHLRYFRDWALSLGADDGAAFLSVIDEVTASADRRVPEEDAAVSVLVGHPLALVRASVRFETAGLPAHRPELRPSAAEGSSLDDLLETHDFQKVRWPLRLGDFQARDDGLVGLFRCATASGGALGTGGPFYPAWGRDGVEAVRAGARVFAAQDFEIDCVRPLEVTMLIDPQVRVHATTGALPRAYLELPHEDVTGAKRAREVFFQTAPVLGLSSTPQMPKPSDDYGEWSWAYRPDVTHWKLDPAIVEATDRAAFSNAWPAIAEGWLKLAIAPVKVLSFWVPEGVEEVAAGAHIHLAWSLQGAESLKLEQVGAGGRAVTLAEWDARPFPREYGVTVEGETTYRLTAFAEDAQPSVKELTVTVSGPDANT